MGVRDERRQVSLEANRKPAQLLSEQDVLNYEMPPMLVDDLIIENTLVQIAADYGVGKSFLALDLALSIAAGRSTFLGQPLNRQGPVLYMVGEGMGRFKLRVMAWKQFHQVSARLPFNVWNGPINLMDAGEVEDFIKALNKRRPALVVIDTLSRCIVGQDENHAAVMTQAVAACDQIRVELGTTVLLLHHMNKGGDKDRGSTTVPAALDTQFFLRRKTKSERGDDGQPISTDLPGRIWVIHKKQKDMELGAKIELVKEVVTLRGQSERNGRPATSCVWRVAGQSDDVALEGKIIEIVSENDGIALTTVAREKLRGVRYDDARAAVRALIAAGKLDNNKGLHLAAAA